MVVFQTGPLGCQAGGEQVTVRHLVEESCYHPAMGVVPGQVGHQLRSSAATGQDCGHILIVQLFLPGQRADGVGVGHREKLVPQGLVLQSCQELW
ncbi:hypothetical protein RKD38_000151 [Streptomyces ambofaciens]